MANGEVQGVDIQLIAETRRELHDFKQESSKRLEKIEDILMKLVNITAGQSKEIERVDQHDKIIVDLVRITGENSEAVKKLSKITLGVFAMISLEFLLSFILIALKISLKL